MKSKYYLLLAGILCKQLLWAGILPTELVHTSAQSYAIQNLKAGDNIISFDGTKVVADKIAQISTKRYERAIKITLKDISLTVSENQFFYLPAIQHWIAAKALQPNDYLLTAAGTSIPIIAIEMVAEPTLFYDLSIQNQHNFYVSELSILVHNEPCTLLFVGAVATSKAAIVAGYAIKTAVVGIMGYFFYQELSNPNKPANPIFPTHTLQPSSPQEKLAAERKARQEAKSCQTKPAPTPVKTGCNHAARKTKIAAKQTPQAKRASALHAERNLKQVKKKSKKEDSESEKSDAQAPGKPTKDDGFEAPKNWDGKKVKNPNGPGYGWPDKRGNVWVPTGPNGHGGPHWDVEGPDNNYENVVPGGGIRGKK